MGSRGVLDNQGHEGARSGGDLVRPATPATLDILASEADACCARARLGKLQHASQLWPAECSWLSALVDFDFSPRPSGQRREREHQHLQLLPIVCSRWPQLGGSGNGGALTLDEWEASGAAHTAPSDGGGPVPNAGSLSWHVALVEATLRHVPGGMLWPQYATLVTQRALCESYHPPDWRASKALSEWSPLCAWADLHMHTAAADQPQGSGCDCLALVAENTRRLFEPYAPEPATPATTPAERRARWRRQLRAPSVAAKLYAPLGGFVHEPNSYTAHLPQLAARGRDQGWLRFLVPLAQHHAEEAKVERQQAYLRHAADPNPNPNQVERQEAYCAMQLRAAATLARELREPRRRPASLERLFVRARTLRGNPTSPSGAGGDGDDGDGGGGGGSWSRQLRTHGPSFLWTPLAHKYALQWNRTLSRRLAEGRRPFFEPDPSSRTLPCAATVTHATLPAEECAAALARLAPGVDRTLEDWHHVLAGVVDRGPAGCVVTMSRAVARPVLDRAGTSGL